MGTEIQKQGNAQPTVRNEQLEQLKAHALALSKSDLMPQAYRNNGPNCLLAMEIANRIGAGVFQVAQNLHIIQGRPSWSSSFLIATVNASGRWSPLKFRMQGNEGKDDWGCRAVATDKTSGEECVGPVVTMAIAKAEGWLSKNGSKWKTMPELMLHYRAAAFWTRIYAPELSMGIHTDDEVRDFTGAAGDLPEALVPGDTSALESALLNAKPAQVVETQPAEPEAAAQPHDPETGELFPAAAAPARKGKAKAEPSPTREPGDEGDGVLTAEQEAAAFGGAK